MEPQIGNVVSLEDAIYTEGRPNMSSGRVLCPRLFAPLQSRPNGSSVYLHDGIAVRHWRQRPGQLPTDS